MDNFIDILLNNPTYLIIAIVLSIVILLSAMKKLLKLALVAAAIFVLLTAYTVWTGQELSDVKDNLYQKSEEAVKKVQEKTQEQIKKQIN